MKVELIELFLNDVIVYKYKLNEPYAHCKKCEGGIRLEFNTMCECSKRHMLNLILDVPARYDCKIKIRENLQKILKKDNTFVVIDGDSKYAKLLAFYIAKQEIEKNDIIAKYVTSKEFVYGEHKNEDIINDIVAFNKADLIIFEDIYKNRSDITYKGELIKRIDANKRTIFVGKTELINVEDDDFYRIEVDSSDITIVKEK